MLRKAFFGKATTILFALLLTSLTIPSYAATPSAGTLSQTLTSLQWQGQFYALASVPAQVPQLTAVCPPAADPLNLICDHFFLTLDLPSDFWTQNSGQVDIRIEWASEDNDFDLYIFDSAGGLVTSSASGGTRSELVSLQTPSPGTYEVRVVPFLVIGSDYQGSASLTFSPGPVITNPLHPTGGITFAPSVIIDPQRTEGEPLNHVDKFGNLWESGPWGASTLQSFIHKSIDNGDSYNIVSPIGLRPDAPPGGGDTDVVTDDQGFVYFVDLEGLAELGVAVSNDDGNTWRKNPTGIPSAGVDRQWFAMDNGPTTGTMDNTVFIAVRQLTPLAGGLQVFSTPGSTGSTDLVGGLVYQNAADTTFIAPDAVCGQPRFEPVHRNLYLVCNRAPNIEVIRGHVDPSQRSGIHFDRLTVPGRPGGTPSGNDFPALTVDVAGNLYAVWIDGINRNVYLSSSPNQGTTWTTPLQVNGDPANTNQFPWAVAGSAGIVDVVFLGTSARGTPLNFPNWFQSRQAGTSVKWFVYMAQVHFDFTSPGSSTIYQAQASEHPAHYGQICFGLTCQLANGDRVLADFFAVTVDRDGAARIVYDDTTNQHHGPGLFEARQIGGPSVLGIIISASPPSNPMTDRVGDAQFPHYSPTGTGTNQKHMDFLGLELSQRNPDSLRVRMVVLEASTLAAPPGAQATIWLTRWQSRALGDDGEESYRIFYVGARSASGQDPTFFSGTGISASNLGVPGNGCITNALLVTGLLRNCKIILYPMEKAQTGKLDRDTGEIIVDVPLADVGSPRVGETLYSVTAFSFGEITGDPLFQDVDATRAFDYTITQGKPITERSVIGGGYIRTDMSGNRGNFGLNAHTDNRGKVTYIHHATGLRFRSALITSVSIEGTRATIKGSGFADGTLTNFEIVVEDKAEPGTGVDTFSIQLGTEYSRMGVLQGGNIQIQ